MATHNMSICNSRADGRSIGSKSLFSFSYQGDGTLSATKCIFSNKTKIGGSTSVTERYCPAVANTFPLYATFMRHLLIIISVLTFIAKASSQNNRFQADTFYKSDGSASFRLIISSDSSFFLASSNHTDAEISKGKWRLKDSRLSLIPDVESDVRIKPSIENRVLSKDTFITFEIFDYFNRPFDKYGVIFFDQDMKEYSYYTNEKGILRVPKKKYLAYLTIDEYNNINIGTEITNIVHFLWNGFSDVTLTMNYPKEILLQAIHVHPFDYKGATYLKSSDAITSISTHAVIKKL